MKQKVEQLYKKYESETNLIITYLPIWLSSYFIKWDSFGVLITYLIEAFILLALFVYLRTNAEIKGKEKFKSKISYGNVLYGVIPFFIFQFFIIAVTSAMIEDGPNLPGIKDLFSIGGIITAAMLAFFYIRSLKSIKSNHHKRMAFYNTFLAKILILTATSLIGLLIASYIEDITLFIVLGFTIPARITGEFIVRKKFYK